MTSHRESPPSGPLVGLRVLDLGQLIAAPLAATLLADFGADVIKVERPGVGDGGRQMGAEKDGVSLWWKVGARNKRCIALDLRDPGDVVVLRGLVEVADVVIENFAPGVLERLGLDVATLQKWNPALIHITVTGFGSSGSKRDQKGFGRTAEAFSGLAYTTGMPDGPPVHLAFPVADCVTGVMAAMAAMMAVYERAANDESKGQHVDLSLFETVFRLMEFVAIEYDQLGRVLERAGAQSSYVAPVNTWQTQDGKWASFTGSTQAIVERTFTAMGMPQLITDPRFANNRSRLAHRHELDSLMSSWMAAHDLEEIIATFLKHDVAIAPVYNIEDIFKEPHYWERDALTKVQDPDLGEVIVQGITPKFSRTPGAIRWLGHHIDADRQSVLHDWLHPAASGADDSDARSQTGDGR